MKKGDVVDDRFTITDVCSTSGGMGNIMFVADAEAAAGSESLVLKYCKAADSKLIARFKREVKVMSGFKGNSRVAQIVAYNVDHDPPYYVMRYYPDGDLTKHTDKISTDATLQEQMFCQVIDCVSELHLRGVFHRDIKPQNFLAEGESIVVSDFGLSLETETTGTVLTSTSEAWGTPGYLPPEFQVEGFRSADATADIFMLGKTIYHLLTRRTPVYMTDAGIPPGLFYVIQRATSLDKTRRYQSLTELKQALVAAYDIILKRVDGPGQCRITLSSIVSRLRNERHYDPDEVSGFLDAVAGLAIKDQDEILQALRPDLFLVISQAQFDDKRQLFLDNYGKMVRRGSYGFSFAETIASCVKSVFGSNTVTANEKATALDLAIHAAKSQNRFDAMRTCNSMITSIDNDELAQHVRPILLGYKGSFVASIESVSCRNQIIAQTIRELGN